MMSQVYDTNHVIRYYECDMTTKLSIPMILNLAILASNLQAESLSIGDDFVHAHGLGWIVLQYDIQIKRRPIVGETVKIETVAKEFTSYFANRDFNFYDEQGELLIEIHSLFAMMDMTKRKMIRIPDEMAAGYEPDVVKRIKRGPGPESISSDDEILHDQMYAVRYTDIDFNHHVNNSRYFEWMIDGLGAAFLNGHEATQIQIRFEKEVGQNDIVTSQIVLDSEKMRTKHRIMVDDQLSAEATINWIEA